ncbi:hypothetical protein G9464_16170 [Halostella sp. JP-L12]|uniref:hypothetical protein n=1 Tax=Halostella TaxID=1843185 RepID=UPI000EF7FB7C|nr:MULTISPECIES: hypothetical protein [Halostella]NHN49117.1 hypothetical protein [Halostella sp. JP-L12]
MNETTQFGSKTALGTQNVSRIVGIATGLVTFNVVLMLVLSYTPVAGIGLLLFSNFFVGIAVFAVTVGGGFWIASKGTEKGSLPLAGAGVALTQAGYSLIGSAILLLAPSGSRVLAIGVAAVVTGAITAGVVVVVFNTARSFEGWQRYAGGLFIGGFALGAVGYFVNPTLVVVAGLLFFLGFVVDLTYEVWAVRENRFASNLRNAIGIYVAVMGVFIHVLQWVIRMLSILDN